MTNCKNCGAPIEIGADKCPYCGTPYSNTRSFGVAGEGFKGRYLGKCLMSGVFSINEYRQLCGLEPIAVFEDFDQEFGKTKELKKVEFQHLDDHEV